MALCQHRTGVADASEHTANAKEVRPVLKGFSMRSRSGGNVSTNWEPNGANGAKTHRNLPSLSLQEQEGGSMGGTLDVWRVNDQVLSLFHIQRWMRNLDGWDACLVSCKCEGIRQLASCTTMFEKSCNKASVEG